MCFSATASFITAGLTAAVGFYAVSRTSSMREFPLASMPLFFAVQQLTEGGLWLTLPISPEGAASSLLSHTFLVFALIFWPLFAPLAAFCVEPDVTRGRLIALCLTIGGGVSAYFLWALLTQPHHAIIVDGHISYLVGETPVTVEGAYMIATTMGLLVSSHRPVAALGLIVLAGSIVSYAVYMETFVSVWCFFAAAASIVVAGHFRAVAARRAAGN
jgi:hypothetical protein